MWASEDEQKESLQRFHMTFWMLDVDLTDLHKKLDTGVSYSKKGRGVIDATCQSSIQNVE